MVGTNAAQMALGLGADVTVLDRSVDVLRRINAQFNGAVKAIYSTADALEQDVLGLVAEQAIDRCWQRSKKPAP